MIRAGHYQKRHADHFSPAIRGYDGSLLSKMRPAAQGGARFGIVLNGSPLLHRDMFYNTGIATYV